jgi:hypothetical protein
MEDIVKSNQKKVGASDGSRAKGNFEVKDVLKKLKLFDWSQKKEAEIEVENLRMEDGEVIGFRFKGQHFQLQPDEYFSISPEYQIYYRASLPGSVHIEVENGDRNVTFYANHRIVPKFTLTDEMIADLDTEYPKYAENIVLISQLNERLRKNPLEAQQILEMVRKETERSAK